MNEINQKMDFENSLKFMQDRELSEFIARQIWEHCQDGIEINKINDERFKSLESRDKKMIGVVSGGSSIVGAAITWAINFFAKGSN